MIIEAINRILELASDRPINVDGRMYWEKSGCPIKPPSVSPVANVQSLDALMSAFDAPELADMNKDLFCSLQVVVVDHRNVSVVSAPDNKWTSRDHYISASCSNNPFPFGRYLEIEEFIIKVGCMFVDAEEKTRLLSLVSSVEGKDVTTNSDDGISQTVQRTTGIHGRLKEEKVVPFYSLRPYRTFPEVEQPESRLLLRMQQQRDGAPSVALFEADGGLWVSKACENVATYLRNDERVKKLGIAVIG